MAALGNWKNGVRPCNTCDSWGGVLGKLCHSWLENVRFFDVEHTSLNNLVSISVLVCRNLDAYLRVLWEYHGNSSSNLNLPPYNFYYKSTENPADRFTAPSEAVTYPQKKPIPLLAAKCIMEVCWTLFCPPRKNISSTSHVKQIGHLWKKHQELAGGNPHITHLQVSKYTAKQTRSVKVGFQGSIIKAIGRCTI